MNNSVFIIPGFHDSGPAHWQSWLQSRLPDTTRLTNVDFERPDLTAWVDQAHRQLAESTAPVWIVAHSFGCLVAAALAAERPESIAGILFIAPADPRRFAVQGGLRNTRDDGTPQAAPSVAEILPETLPASLRSVVIASENDPWLSYPNALAMAAGWGSHVVSLGEAGHVNTESGYGPWPGLLRQLVRLRNHARPDLTLLNAHGLERGDAQADDLHDGYYQLWNSRKRPPPAFHFAF